MSGKRKRNCYWFLLCLSGTQVNDFGELQPNSGKDHHSSTFLLYNQTHLPCQPELAMGAVDLSIDYV